jgi:predicted amidohydrolase
MLLAAVQMACSADRDDNLRRAATLISESVDQGAGLVVLPELFASLGRGSAMRASAEPIDGPTMAWAAEQATRHRVWLAAGSLVERDGDRLYNTAPLLSPEGGVVATYRKIHLFDVEVEGAGTHESEVFTAGDEIATANDGHAVVGLTTCYDLRFPELFRILALRGVQVVTMPSAFTAATGIAHWEPLIRSRAIENQVFVVAPDQCGTSPDGIARHGHSMIVDPWGRVLADGGADAETVVVAEADLGEIDRVRSAIPSLANRRPSTYVWPD